MRFSRLLVCLWALCQFAWAEPSYDPVRNGQAWTFTDPLYGYSITFPDGWKIKSRPEVMRAIRNLAGELPHRDNEGSRFSLGVPALSSGGVIPSLTGRVAGVNPKLGSVTTAELSQTIAKDLQTSLDAVLLGPIEAVTINGVEFRRIDYSHLYPPKNVTVVCRSYCYFDAKARLCYDFTLNSAEKNAERNLAALEAAMKTVHIGENPGPAPVDVKGPSGLRSSGDTANSR